MTKAEIQKSTLALMHGRVQQKEKVREGFFKPMWMRSIPMTLEDFKTKEDTWLGFHYALKNIGLEYNEVKKRLSEGKETWKDLEKQQRICQQACMEHQM